MVNIPLLLPDQRRFWSKIRAKAAAASECKGSEPHRLAGFGVLPTSRGSLDPLLANRSGFHTPEAGFRGFTHPIAFHRSGFHPPPGPSTPSIRTAFGVSHTPGPLADDPQPTAGRSFRGFAHLGACGQPRGFTRQCLGVSSSLVTGFQTLKLGVSPARRLSKRRKDWAVSRRKPRLTTLTFLLRFNLTGSVGAATDEGPKRGPFARRLCASPARSSPACASSKNSILALAGLRVVFSP